MDIVCENTYKKRCIQYLVSQKWTLASCESVTGGLFASDCVSVEGSSRFFIGSIVSYHTSVKLNVVKVLPLTIKKYGVVSKQVAREMARQVAKELKATIGVSFTGNAGNQVIENKTRGLIFACIYKDEKYYDFCWKIDKDRNEIRQQCVELMWQSLWNILGNKDNNYNK